MRSYNFIFTLVINFVVVWGAPGPLSHKSPSGVSIVGGKDADIRDFPYQISLQSHEAHICGGSIISPNYVITAAHCTDGAGIGFLSVRVGSSVVKEGGKLIKVKTINVHPQFDNNANDYDISVLELEETLTFDDKVAPISLPLNQKDIAEGTRVNVTGWGNTEEGGALSPQLQVVEVTVVSRNECAGDYTSINNITPQMICAGVPEGGKDACQGDSGGPLVSGGQLYGIVSWGLGCARKGYPGVYSDVATLRGYVTQITGL